MKLNSVTILNLFFQHIYNNNCQQFAKKIDLFKSYRLIFKKYITNLPIIF